MNIIPTNYTHNAPITNFAHPGVQNDALFLLSKRSNSSKFSGMSSGSSQGDDERKHIKELSRRLPGLTNIFNVHHKIGEGSFSSVFLASLKYHNHLPREQRKLFAIKHLVPTSHPSRIEQELRCLKYIGGCENVVGLDFCMRKYDTVIFVMPYLPHSKFSEYVLKMDVEETKLYVKNLLLALQRVHQFNVIHRDVKPSNFLYDRINKRYLLVDFGLAQKIDCWPTSNVPKNNATSVTNPSTNSTNANGLPLDASVSSLDAAAKNVTDRKRKYDDLNDGQNIIGELEPCPKKQQLRQPPQNNTGVDCTPLKPLQEDHPKIIPTTDMCPPVQRSQAAMPKLSSVKRQVFIDNENKTKLETSNSTNKRLENVYSNNSSIVTSVQNYATNTSYSNTLSQSYANGYYMNSLQNPYHHHPMVSYPIGVNAMDSHELSQYLNLYYAQSGNMLINMITDTAHYRNRYEFYKNQLLTNQYGNYINSCAMNDSKFNMFYPGYVSALQKNVPANKVTGNVNKVYNSQKLEKGNVSKQVSVKHEALRKDGSMKSGSTVKICGCGGKPAVCSICLGRGAYNAPRAGTQGFRPPEVLLKYTEQTTAVDLWACGVILLSIVSGCYPFFRAPDDLTALAEMVTLFGTKPLKEVATILGRHLMCSHMKKPLDLRKLCSHLRYRALKTNSAGSSDLVKSTIDYMQDLGCQGNPEHDNKTDYKNNKLVADNECQKLNDSSVPPNSRNKNTRNANAKRGNVRYCRKTKKSHCDGCTLHVDSCICASEESQKNSLLGKADRTWCGFPDDAFDLLERLLDLNPHTRITATEALQHPFLAGL